MTQIVTNLADEDLVKKTIQECKKPDSNKEQLIFLGFLANHKDYFYLFEDQVLIENQAKHFVNENQGELIDISILKFFSEIIDIDSNQVKFIQEQNII